MAQDLFRSFSTQQPKTIEKPSDESDQATWIEARGPHVAPDNIPGTSIPMASTSTLSSDKRHKPSPVGASRLNGPDYPQNIWL